MQILVANTCPAHIDTSAIENELWAKMYESKKFALLLCSTVAGSKLMYILF